MEVPPIESSESGFGGSSGFGRGPGFSGLPGGNAPHQALGLGKLGRNIVLVLFLVIKVNHYVLQSWYLQS